MKKRIFIESIRCACDIPRGPAPGAVNAEAGVAVLDEKGMWRRVFVTLSLFDNVYILFETKESVFEKIIANDEETLGRAKCDVLGTSAFKKTISRLRFRRVYEYLFGLLAVPEADVATLPVVPIPDDGE